MFPQANIQVVEKKPTHSKFPPESRKTDNVTYKWPRAWGATMS